MEDFEYNLMHDVLTAADEYILAFNTAAQVLASVDIPLEYQQDVIAKQDATRTALAQALDRWHARDDGEPSDEGAGGAER